jgi:hypothetical protein
MRLSVIQIMIGTVPIVFLIFPTCLMGALIYLAGLDSDTGNPVIPWAGTAATICASVTAAVQFGSMIVAAYYLERTGEQRQAEIEAIEIDQEVKEADDRDEHIKQCKLRVSFELTGRSFSLITPHPVPEHHLNKATPPSLNGGLFLFG